MRKITAVALDDQPLLLAGIRSLIAQDPEIDLVGEGSVGEHLFSLVEKHQPNVVLLDLNMPHQEGGADRTTFQALPAINQLHRDHPQTVVIVLSQHISVTLIEGAFEIGVRGYILKDDIVSLNLPEAIRAVHQGRLFLSEAIKDELLQSRHGAKHSLLTKRQKQIVRQLASNLDMSISSHAAVLGITEASLRNHLSNMFRALNVSNISSCIVTCMRLGLVPFDTTYIE